MDRLLASQYKGTIKICLWFLDGLHPVETGPPIPNYYLEFRGKNLLLASGYTDTNGCFSAPFESSWPGQYFSLTTNYGNSQSAKPVYPSASDQIVDFGNMGIRDYALPEKYFTQEYDCSTCDSYFADSDFDSTASTEATATSLSRHTCSSNQWGFDCCTYDWNSDSCGVQQLFPEFIFLHKCSGCQRLPEVEFKEGIQPGFKESDPPPPIDCSVFDMYYPSSSMLTPANERDIMRPLTNHACTYEDQNSTSLTGHVSRYGSSCCAYDYETKQCGLWEYEMGYTYMNEIKGRFIYPCESTAPGSNIESTAPGSNIVLIVGATISVVVTLAIVGFSWVYIRKRHKRRKHQRHDVVVEMGKKEHGKAKRVTFEDIEQNGAYHHPDTTFVPMEPSAPPKDEDIVVMATPVAGGHTVVQAKLCDVVEPEPPAETELTFLQKLDLREIEEKKRAGYISDEEYKRRKKMILVR